MSPLQIYSDQLIVADPSDLRFLLQMCRLDTLFDLDGWLDGLGGWTHGCCILGHASIHPCVHPIDQSVDPHMKGGQVDGCKDGWIG